MKKFRHINARSLEEATSILENYKGRAKIISGGTDLIGGMKDNILPMYPDAVVNIKTIPDLDFIKEKGKKVIIGALTRLDDIANDTTIKEKLPMLAHAASVTASPHIREMGTIGGNISQANRCWYYWVPDNRFYCMRKGGDNCYALTGDNRYHSIFGGVRVNRTPCSIGCPNNVDIPSYMGKIREGNIADAAKILMQNNPLPAITGRVCPHFCEGECNRRETDEAVSIRGVEKYIGDYVLEHSDSMYASPKTELKKNVAVIGSGPSGLSAAYFLRKTGYKVTILEEMEQAGGLLVYGIPPYRLPKDVVKRQVKVLEDMGVQIKLGFKVTANSNINEIMSGYDAVYMACGAWKEKSSGMKGEEHTMSGARFLRKANLGLEEAPGKKIAVIGGGNVAIDVARTLLRLGSEPVIIYRRGKAEMPALKDEVEKAEEEGIKIEFLTLPVEVIKRNNKIALICQRMVLGPADESGRPRPVAISGSDYTVEYDAVMTAIGEKADTSVIPKKFLNEKGKIAVDEYTYHINKNLFAGGDLATGPSTVVAAIAAGRKAAASINRYLKGPELKSDKTDDKCHNTELAEKFNSDFLRIVHRNEIPELPAEKRLKSLNVEEAGGFDLNTVKEEANRCLNCSCVAVNPSDTAPALIALNAKIVTTKRKIDIEKFFAVGVDTSTILEHDEVVKEIEIPIPSLGVKTVFKKFALRKSIDFPVVNCAAAIEIENGIVKSARICLNSVYNVPIRVTNAERIITGKTIDESIAEEAAKKGLADTLPLTNNRYKVYIARTLVKRAILACLS